MLKMFDPNKEYGIEVYDITYHVYDDEAEDYIRNDDGSIKVFYAPDIDYSYTVEGIAVDELEEA